MTGQSELKKGTLHGPDITSISQETDFIGGNKYYTVIIEYEFKRFD